MLNVSINTDKINTEARRTKIRAVQKEMIAVFNSTQFRQLFLLKVQSQISSGNFTKGEKSKFKSYVYVALLYDYFMNGSEVLSPAKDGVVDIVIDDYRSWKGVIGYTYPSKPTIYVNTRFFDKRSNKMCGSNLAHEYMHKKGFKHSFKKNKYRRYSMPYLMNEIYEESFDMVFLGIQPTVAEILDKPLYQPTKKSLWSQFVDVLIFWR